MMTGGTDIPPHVLEAAARKYVWRVVRRYSPLLVGGLAVLLVAVLLPSISNNPPGYVAGTGTGGGYTGSTSAGSTGTGSRTNGTAGGASGAGATSGAGAAGGAGGAAAGGPGAATVGAGNGSGSGITGPNGTPGAPPTEQSGLAVTGIRCGTGVRQFTWSAYAPYCVPAWSGKNGGATAQGVTGNTITITYRETNSSDDAAVEAYAEGAGAGSDAQYVQDLQTYVKYFNSQFELYGRHVVLKPFTGQGDPLLEDQGQDLEGAQADAATAQSAGSFTDVSSILGEATQPFDDDLAQDHISSWGNVYPGQAEVSEYAPYIYTTLFPTGDVADTAFTDIICRKMAGLKAIFSPAYASTTRKFGLILPDRPGSTTSQKEIDQQLAACGASFAEQDFYTINVGEMPEQANSIMAHMHALGVTTILCGCDPVFDAILSNSANGQAYQPEWLSVWWGDSFAQLTNQTSWAHDIANGGATPDLQKTEAYTAFKLADPSGQPAEAYYSVPYIMLMLIFSALQSAGPDLTPYTFANGFFHLPGGNGTFGPLGFAQGKYDPMVAFQVGAWSSTQVSAYNNKAGAYQTCDTNQWVYYNDLQALGPDHTQLQCPAAG